MFSQPVCAKPLLWCLTLCDLMDCSLPSSPVHGNFQARILKWLPFPPPGNLPNPGIEHTSLISPVLEVRCLFVCLFVCTTSTTWKAKLDKISKIELSKLSNIPP